MKPIRFTVSGQPIPKQSFRYSKRGNWQPARVKAWQEAVGWAALQAMSGRDPLSGPLHLEIVFYREKTPVPADLDNLEKGTIDGMQGVCFENDNQITWKETIRHWVKKHPRAEIMVEEIVEMPGGE